MSYSSSAKYERTPCTLVTSFTGVTDEDLITSEVTVNGVVVASMKGLEDWMALEVFLSLQKALAYTKYASQVKTLDTDDGDEEPFDG